MLFFPNNLDITVQTRTEFQTFEYRARGARLNKNLNSTTRRNMKHRPYRPGKEKNPTRPGLTRSVTEGSVKRWARGIRREAFPARFSSSLPA